MGVCICVCLSIPANYLQEDGSQHCWPSMHQRQREREEREKEMKEIQKEREKDEATYSKQ
jgi:hypothetical protein